MRRQFPLSEEKKDSALAARVCSRKNDCRLRLSRRRPSGDGGFDGVGFGGSLTQLLPCDDGAGCLRVLLGIFFLLSGQVQTREEVDSALALNLRTQF